jgi:CheY-like chemotaxis protein
LATGFRAYLTKPVRRATLFRAIATAAGRAIADSAALDEGADAPTTSVEKNRDAALADGTLILVAEDNPTNQMLIQRQLAKLGYAVDLAVNGKIALAMFHATAYGLVIADCHMPEMDGFEMTAAMRDVERMTGRRRVPIVALTANVLHGEAERCLASGMDDYMSKPVNLARLSETLKRWASNRTAALAASDAVAATSAEPIEAVNSPIDLNLMRELFGAIDETAKGLLRRFADTTGNLIAELDRASAARDGTAAREAAHSIKGAARSAGAGTVAEHAGIIEIAAKSGDWYTVDGHRPALAESFARAARFIEDL